MTYRSHSFWRRGAAPLAIAAAMTLNACHPASQTSSSDAMLAQAPSLPATLPLAAGPAATPSYAPAVTRLPAAPRLSRVRVADPGSDYAYADNAWNFGEAAFDGPPDYGFDYQGVEPWAWEGYDRSVTFVEPIDDGYRYYYYQPGADEPYYVRDPDYGYGYDNGRLAVIYARDGSIIPYNDYGPRADYAARYQSRGLALYQASQARERRAVIAANWAARSAAISATQARLAEDRARQDAWRAYHARVAPQAQAHWRDEQERRQADAAHFADWRSDGFRTAPPPRVIPVAWQQAKWARNDQHYVSLAQQQAQRGAVAAQRQQQAAQREATQREAMQQQRQAESAAGPLQPGGERALPGGGSPILQPARQQAEQARAQDQAQHQADRAAQTEAQAQQRAAVAQQREAQRGQVQAAQAQARIQARAQEEAGRRQQQQAQQQQARSQAREQADVARHQAASQARSEAQGEARAQAQAAREAQRNQAQAARGQAENQARAQAQAARSQAEGQARAQAQAAHDAQRAQAQAARAQAQAARPAPAPRPTQPAPGGNGGGHGGDQGGEHGGGHDHHGG